MSPIAGPLARRIDRLARRAHAFHRFAHHPLCDRYAGEFVPLGRRVRVCRGCALALAGLGAGLAAGLAPWRAGAPALAVLGFLLWLVDRLGSQRPWGRRPSKSVTRFAPAAPIGLAIGEAARLRSQLSLALAVAAVAAAISVLARYRRRGPSRAPCLDCPERTLSICSGFRPIAQRERAFQRLAGSWIARGEQKDFSPRSE